MSIELKAEIRNQAIQSLQRYFEVNMEEALGNLKANEFLDYLLEEIGPCIYNQAVIDAQEHLQVRVQEMDIDVHEEEFSYWSKQSKMKKR